MIEIASGDYNVDMNKLMATAVKKYYEERDTNYLNTINRHDYISAAESGMQTYELISWCNDWNVPKKFKWINFVTQAILFIN